MFCKTNIYIYIIYIFVGQVFECWFFFTAKNWGRLSQLGLALQSNIDGKSRLWRGKLLWFGDIPRYSSYPKSPKAVLSESLPKVAQNRIHSRFLTILEPLYVPFRLLGPLRTLKKGRLGTYFLRFHSRKRDIMGIYIEQVWCLKHIPSGYD